MKNYIDKYGRIHDKPLSDPNDIPSNNGWIYTAYYKKIGGEVNIDEKSAWICADNLMRHPIFGVSRVPFGRDELMGLEFLGFKCKMDGWNFSPFKLPKFNLFKTIASFVLAIGEHRNFLWLKDLQHSYVLMFSTPIHDRAFILKCRGEKPNVFYRLFNYIDSKLKPSSNSGALIRWLKYDQLPSIEIFEEYFGKDHPITIERRKL